MGLLHICKIMTVSDQPRIFFLCENHIFWALLTKYAYTITLLLHGSLGFAFVLKCTVQHFQIVFGNFSANKPDLLWNQKLLRIPDFHIEKNLGMVGHFWGSADLNSPPLGEDSSRTLIGGIEMSGKCPTRVFRSIYNWASASVLIGALFVNSRQASLMPN